jgi:SEC-C motif domain protein
MATPYLTGVKKTTRETVRMRSDEPCPCGTGDDFGACCQPLLRGERQAATAAQLMRSRYSAYVVEDFDYVWRTWHPSTRPDSPPSGKGPHWVGLSIVDVVAGQPEDDAGEVEFKAYYREDQRSGTLHERSRFAVRARRWFYVDGDEFG